jgi:hypothetical protein
MDIAYNSDWTDVFWALPKTANHGSSNSDAYVDLRESDIESKIGVQISVHQDNGFLSAVSLRSSKRPHIQVPQCISKNSTQALWSFRSKFTKGISMLFTSTFRTWMGDIGKRGVNGCGEGGD